MSTIPLFMNLDKFNLNLFVALEAVLHARNLTDAARTLHLTQPALSIALKKLREIYNDEIVVYTGGETVLTPLGEALRPRVRELIQAAKDTLKVNVQFDPATARNSFRIVSPDVLELLFLKGVFVEMVREAPGIHVTSAAFNYRPVEQMMNNDVDLVIVSGPFLSDKFSREDLFTESFSCMVWEGNAKVGPTLTAEEYMRQSHADLDYEASNIPDAPAFDLLRRISAERHVTLQTSVYSSLPHMVVGTDLVVTTLTRYANWCAARLPIRVLPYPFPMPPIVFSAQWQPYRDEDPSLLWIRSKLRAMALRLDGPPPHPAGHAMRWAGGTP